VSDADCSDFGWGQGLGHGLVVGWIDGAESRIARAVVRLDLERMESIRPGS
jgi:hypothetical protein